LKIGNDFGLPAANAAARYWGIGFHRCESPERILKKRNDFGLPTANAAASYWGRSFEHVSLLVSV